MIPPSYLEITTQIGCSVACLKHCPQELIVKNYRGNRVMSLEQFKGFIRTVPQGLPIFFSGLSEPFQNQEAVDMISWAYHARGHPVSVFSTLTGLKPCDAERLCEIPIDKFVLHLPDAYGNAKIPNHSQEYKDTRAIIESGIEHIETMSMGWNFVSNRCEDMARGKITELKQGRRLCNFLESPAYQLLPNGDVFFCCMVRGLSEKVGSLHENTYPELASLHPDISYRLQTDPRSVCHICNVSEKYWIRRLIQKKNEMLHDKTIMQILAGE